MSWYPNFDELENLPLDEIKLMWVNYPNMPTGTPATIELFEQLVAFGKKHNIVIVNDNPYSFILNDKPISILSVEGAKNIAIEMNSLSKSHNMAGWRMGMLASNRQFIEWILKVKSNIDSGQFKPSMEAAVEALGCDKEWYEILNKVYAERRKIAERIMEALGCEFDTSQKGLFLWGKIPQTAESSEKFADKILYEARVFLTPGFIFGSNGERYIRISLCAKRRQNGRSVKSNNKNKINMENIKQIIFDGIDCKRPIVIAGPCSAETEEQVITTAKDLAKSGIQIFRAGIWKPRTKPGGFEGVGKDGLPWLQRVKKKKQEC